MGVKVIKKSGVLHHIPVVGGVVGAVAAGAGTMGKKGGVRDVAGARQPATKLGGSKGQKGGALDVAEAMKLATQLGGLKVNLH